MNVSPTVAETIKAQLGGAKFETTTGAHLFTGTTNGLSFRLRSNPKRINGVRIVLNGNDEYDIEFAQISVPRFNTRTGKTKGGYHVVSKAEGVQVAQLREVFTRHTGLLTSL